MVEHVKFVRVGFFQTVKESGIHRFERPIVPNGLTRRVDELFLSDSAHAAALYLGRRRLAGSGGLHRSLG